MKKYIIIIALSLCNSTWAMNHTTSNTSTQKKTTTEINQECCLDLILTKSGWRTEKTNSQTAANREAIRNLGRSSLFVVNKEINPQINTRAKL
jgi:hypothetical protein